MNWLYVDNIFNLLKMKELTQIIDQLHTLNEQIVEKDNMIDHMQTIVSLMTKMIADPILIRSDVYLDLKAKYLSTIEERLKKIEQTSVVIEPENLLTTTTSSAKNDPNKPKVRQFTKDQVKAPIRTDIFQAPGCRRTYARGKKEPKTPKDGADDKNATSTNTNTNTATVPARTYVSFDHKDERYYIDITVKDPPTHVFEIFDEQMKIKGTLSANVVTLISEEGDDFKTEQIQLPTVTQPPPGGGPLFGNSVGQYLLDEIL